MGCYFSQHHLRESNSRLFRVFNVNDLGVEISPGKIEVTENDLIFYQKGKEPILWPLRCLRRYGFDEELFSFESGRRCPTGSGIYAFRCRRAEELFNLVQEAIQTVGQQAHLRASQTIVNGGNSLPMVRATSRPSSQVEHNEPSMRLSGSGRVAVVPYDQHLYMNGSAVQDDSQPNYINTGSATPANNREEHDEARALIDFLHDPPIAPGPPKNPDPMVTYADLDLPRSNDNIFAACEGATAAAPANSALTADMSRDERGASGSGSSGQEGLDVDDINADVDVFQENAEDSQPNYINVTIEAEGKAKDRPNGAVGASARVDVVDGPNGATAGVNRRLLERKPSIQQEYQNLGVGSFTNIPDPLPVSGNQNGQASSHSSHSLSSAANRDSMTTQLNYIEIDVNKTESDNVQGATAAPIMSVSYSGPESPSKKTGSYAMIDFNRTEALSNSSKVMSGPEEGHRKTRHNSTIS